jgi:hypothetical protein
MTFDYEAWTSGAKRLRRSVLIYSRPDLIADLDRISQTKTTSESCGVDTFDLDREWEKVAQEFADSALRVTFESRTMDEIKAVQAQCIGVDDDEEAQSRLLADAIVEPQMSWTQLFDLRKVIGDNQVNVLVEAWSSACIGEVPLAPRTPPRDNGDRYTD